MHMDFDGLPHCAPPVQRESEFDCVTRIASKERASCQGDVFFDLAVTLQNRVLALDLYQCEPTPTLITRAPTIVTGRPTLAPAVEEAQTLAPTSAAVARFDVGLISHVCLTGSLFTRLL
jgi:hypothetical protein